MSQKIDMTGWKMWEHGVTNSRLTVDSFAYKSSTQGNMWNCQCACGNTNVASGYALRSGRIKSCGCLTSETTSQRNMSHIKQIIGYSKNNLLVIEDLGLRPQTSRNEKERWVKCRCLICNNEIEVRWNNVQSGAQKSCGCMSSYGEKIIADILKKAHINYKKQYSFDNLIGERGNKLRFDFGILDTNNNLIKLIEFDGRQHFTGPEGNWTHSDSLETIQKRDAQKDEFCKNNNILLQRIPYTQIKNINLELLLQGVEQYYEQ